MDFSTKMTAEKIQKVAKLMKHPNILRAKMTNKKYSQQMKL